MLPLFSKKRVTTYGCMNNGPFIWSYNMESKSTQSVRTGQQIYEAIHENLIKLDENISKMNCVGCR